MNPVSENVIIYTDGGCEPNPGIGGWAAVILFGKHRKELYGGELDSTNNRMELMAAIVGLEDLSQACEVQLYTDSTYVKNGITQWIVRWKKRGWGTAAGAPVKNIDLWQRLDVAAQRHQVEWIWVKGHSGQVGNEKADELARLAIDDVS